MTPSQDLGKILASFNEVNIGGEADLYRGIQVRGDRLPSPPGTPRARIRIRISP